MANASVETDVSQGLVAHPWRSFVQISLTDQALTATRRRQGGDGAEARLTRVHTANRGAHRAWQARETKTLVTGVRHS